MRVRLHHFKVEDWPRLPVRSVIVCEVNMRIQPLDQGVVETTQQSFKGPLIEELFSIQIKGEAQVS